MEQYLYADEYDDNEIKILTVGQLLEFFNKSDDKKNGSSLDDYIKDNIKMDLIEPFCPHKEAETVVCDLQPLAKQYILQEAKKVFDGIAWVNTEEELDNVYHEKIKNLYDTVDFSEFVAYLQIEYYRQVKTRLVYFVELINRNKVP